MKTITIEVFKFNELSEKAKEKARDWFRESLEFDGDNTKEDAKAIAALMGIEISEIYFSGFSSQGDGAMFEGIFRACDVKIGGVKGYAPLDAELHRIASEFELVAQKFPSAYFKVKHTGRYYHENCTDFYTSISDEDGEIESEEASEAEKMMIQAAKDFMKWIYRQLESEYGYQNSNEYIDDNIILNEYDFTEDGKRY